MDQRQSEGTVVEEMKHIDWLFVGVDSEGVNGVKK